MAKTAHSPNRKERLPRDPAKSKRNPWRANAKSNAIETKKERIVQGVAVGKTRSQAAIAAGMSPEGLKKLVKTHPGLEKKIVNAEAEFRRGAAGVIDTHLEESAEEFVRLGLHAESEKVRAHVLGMELRGRGVLPGDRETPEPLHTPERILIVNIIGNPEARQAAITLARAIEIQEAQEHENT